MITRRQERERKPWTIVELLDWTEKFFEKLELPTPRLDAELLLAHTLGSSRLDLYTEYGKLVEPLERATYRAYVARRAKREPVAYITGRREFFSLSFEVSPDVLIPRPETEHLVEIVLEASLEKCRVLDLCTGCGNVGIALAVNLPQATVDAVDSSGPALDVARRNAEAHGVADRIRFLEGDLFLALPDAGTRYDVVISNPPYIPAEVYEGLMDDVRLYEPRCALVDLASPSGDGLGFYRRIAEGAATHLGQGGLAAVEIGADQSAAVEGVFSRRGWTVERVVKDFGGVERVVVFRALRA